jgi:aerobic-type carbon monoxide dehydrogenase small subunit (CoxS/CutS family)
VTDDQHGEGTPQGGGRWDPLPQGDYDDGATAFVQLPEGGIDALLASADSPLAARGHGYVPPQITVDPGSTAGADPAATGTWAVPADGAQWPDPNAVPQDTAGDRFTYNPAATQQWHFEETATQESAPAPGHDVTGQWSIPVAGGDLPDESGEFTTSSLVQQWGGTPPATLPGGAPAPWATEAAGQPWGQQPAAGEDGAGQVHESVAGTGTVPEQTAGTRDPHGQPGAVGHAPVETGHESEAARAHDGERPHDAGQPGDAYAGPPHVEEHAAGHTESEAPAGAPVAASQPAHGAGETLGAAEGAREAAQAAESAVEAFTETAAAAADAVPGSEDAEERAHARDGSAAANTPDAADASGHPDSDGTPAPTDDPAETADESAPPPSGEEHPLASYVLRVNGVERPVSDAWIGESLLYVLRERLGLAGAKDGCSQGECGACNVQVDGRLVASCLVPAVTAAGSEVRTVEGLAVDGQPSDVQRALARCGAVQCGFCVPGMAMTVHDLLEGNPAPTELETRQALCGNLCRCSGYRGVVEAVQEVVAEREAHAAGDAGEQNGDEARIPHQAGPGAGGVNPSAFESPGAMNPGSTGPHDEPYGQDGGQA